MKYAVNPNRMELLKLKKRLSVAKRGHTLLRSKQDELVRRLGLLIGQYRGLRQSSEKQLASLLTRFVYVRQTSNFSNIGQALFFNTKSFSLISQTQKIMNVTIPKFNLQNEPTLPFYGFNNVPSELDAILSEFKKIFPSLVKLAELEISVKLLAEETNKTRRRVNALEYVMIPNLEVAIKFIEMKLDEFERSTLTRLMRIKEIVQK